MPHKERTGTRKLIYSAWHRKDSIKRFLAGNEVVASRLMMIDIDGMWIEAKHPYDRPPVALIETVEISYKLKPESYYPKSVNILYQLGKAANIPVFLVLYLADYSQRNPASPNEPDIVEFYVKEYYPVKSKLWKCYTPEGYAKFLVYLRQSHIRIKQKGPQLILPADHRLMELDDSDLERRWFVHEFEKKDFRP